MSSMSIRTPAVNWGELDGIVGARNVRAAMSDDSVVGVQPVCVVEPGTNEEVARVLQWANANEVRVLPRGNGTKLEWGNAPSSGDLALSMRRMNRVLEHAWADMTATVEAGCTVQRLQQTLADHGQRLAIDVVWPERATIGGILATNDSGALRLRFGSLRDLIIGVTVALPDGTLARSGGKVVKNVAGYDLPKLMTGALGTLGVITQAIFRLHPRPQQTKTFTFAAPNCDDANRFMLRVQDSQLAHVAMQMRASGSSHPPLGKGAAPASYEGPGTTGQTAVDVLFEGTETGIAAQAAHVRELAGKLVESVPEADAWSAREELWRGDEPSLVAKLSVLPENIAATTKMIADECQVAELRWNLVAQAIGVITLRMESAVKDTLVNTAMRLRHTLARPSAGKGAALQVTTASRDGVSLMVLHRPNGAVRIEAWGEPGNALSLMMRVKQQFDPKGTLNPGRFVGGI
jgi:glycolate dehydrogenase FAD-binding subunit